MRHRSVQSRAGSLTAAAVLAVGFGVSAAQAGLVLDLKLTGGGTSTTVNTGAVVNLDVFATVTGAGAGAEGLQDVFFGVTNSGTAGDLSLVTLQSPFNGVSTIPGSPSTNVTTSSSGTLYGPAGSKDVGSTDSSAADGWVFARSTSMTTVTDGAQTKIGTLTFTATATGSTTLAINARQAVNSLVIPAVWQEDGAEKDGAYTLGSSVSITVASSKIPGDTNNDHVVDLTDLNNVLNNFGSNNPGNPGDDNGDNVVDLTDLNAVLNNFGRTNAAAALSTVPEPASLGLIGLGAAALIGRRRRR